MLSLMPALAMPIFARRHKSASTKKLLAFALILLLCGLSVFVINYVFIELSTRDSDALSPYVSMGVMFASELWCLNRYKISK